MTYQELYATEYLGRIFYYSLRKTGGEAEAEELSSDITLAILSELHRGVIPDCFSAWVFGIAKNRYARWAQRKHRVGELFDPEDISEHTDVAEDVSGVLEDMIRREELLALRRELAHIRSDYRRVLVAFYIEDKSLPVIAKETGLPLGTVKTRLISARKILKEGMDMAREFGKLSYRPENISFSFYVANGKNGEPWSLFNKLLPKNILLAAYRTPMTAEELSLELGVALPYLEEEIAVLESRFLLRKAGKKYESTVPIISADGQRRVFDKKKAIAPEMLKKIEAYYRLRDELYEKNGLRWDLGAQPEEDRRFARLMRASDVAEFYVMDGDYHKWTSRPGGSEWDMVGYEEYDDEKILFVGQHGVTCHVMFSQYKFMYRGLDEKSPMYLKNELAKALEAVCEKREADADAVRKLLDMGYLKEENGTLIPQMMVVDDRFGDVGAKGLPEEDAAKLMALWDEVVSCQKEMVRFVEEKNLSELPACIDPATRRLVLSNLSGMRGALFMAALDAGYISYEEGDPRHLLGTMITVNRNNA